MKYYVVRANFHHNDSPFDSYLLTVKFFTDCFASNPSNLFL